MYTSPAKPGWHIIDGQRVYTDSLMEARIIKRLAEKQGFSGKWSRPYTGIEFGKSRYTPDLELSVDDNGISRRAIVELKSTSATQFTVKDRERACAAAHYYSGAIVLLYVNKTRRWYKIDPITKHVVACAAPKPSQSTLQAHAKPLFSFPSINRFARPYRSHGAADLATKSADVLEFGVKALFRPTKKLRRRRKK